MNLSADVEKLVDMFKQDFRLIVRIFLNLKARYEHDDSTVLNKIGIFKTFLLKFNEKYKSIEIILCEEDLTADDFKIFLTKFNSKEEIINKYQLESIPLMMKKDKDKGFIQVFMDYSKISDDINSNLTFLGLLCIEDIDKKIDLRPPKELKLLSSEIDNEFASLNQSMANRA